MGLSVENGGKPLLCDTHTFMLAALKGSILIKTGAWETLVHGFESSLPGQNTLAAL